jgi:signal transduction histidine kinase/ActR/RegA family two-component response regulator
MEAQLAVGIILGLLLSLVLYATLRLNSSLLFGAVLGQKAQESLGVLQTFYEHAPSLLGIVELAGEDIYHVYDNPAACRFFGVLTGQTRGRLEADLGVPREQTALWAQNLRESLSRRSPVRFEFHGGDSRWFAVTVCPVIEHEKVVQQFCYLAEDISEWKNNAELASIDRQRLQFALVAARLGFWDWNVTSGRYQYGGDWSNLLSFPEDHFKPTLSPWESLIHPDDAIRVMDILRSNLEGKTPEFEAECRFKMGTGDFLWVSARGRVIERDPNGSALRHVGVVEDIDERRNVREQLKVNARQKDEFLATLAHELRNPLAPIRTGLAIIKCDPTSDAACRARDMMERQLLHLVRLIDDLLDISRISLGRLTLKKAPITAKEIVDTAVEGSLPFIESNQHTLSIDLPSEPITIDGDLTRLAQVLSNLLNNSAKYTPKGGHIELQLKKLPKVALFKVSDNGLGIPPQMLESIFDMFGQVNRTLDRAQGGLGIGLALVRKLVELHNGTVHAESDGPGRGSTFTVLLPLLTIAGEEPLDVEHPDPSLQALPKKILVVDDNIDSAESLATFLQMHGHSTRVAHTPAVALAMQGEFRPDVIFLDIGLPEMNGYEVARRIRAAPQGTDTCLVAITGWGGEKDKENAKAAGFNAHLTKPVDLCAVQMLLRSGSGQMEFRS